MKRFIIASLLVIGLVTSPILGASAGALSIGTGGMQISNYTPVSRSATILNVASTSFDTCLKYTNHVYEVCTAYIGNSSLAVLVPYYKYSRSTNMALQRYVTYRLGSRYTGNANAAIIARTAYWPAGSYNVSVPDIHIVSASSSLATNTATLQTVESWIVKNSSNQIVYQEVNQPHLITMQRVPSYVLHKWVVTGIR